MSTQAYCLRSAASYKVCGVAQGPKADEVIVTVQNDGVVCYSSARQEQTRSWALNSQQLEFVVPTVHCQASDRYYTVVQEKKASSSTPQTLLSWPATVTHGSLEQTAQRQPLQGIVHSIHAPPAAAVKTPARGQSSGIVIVYTDGTVVSSNTEAVASVKAVGKRVINANVNGNQLAVVSTGKSRSDSMLELYSLQALKLDSTYTIPTPHEALKVVSVCFQGQQLSTLWSNSLLQSFDVRPRSKSLKLRTSRTLPAYMATPQHTATQAAAISPVPSKALKDSCSKGSRARKRRQPEADSAEIDEPASSSTGIITLGQHAIAAVRQLTDLPTNGHAAAAVEVTVMDSSYGCVQSVTGVRLPKAQADAKMQLTQGSMFQQRTGSGELVLLYGNAVWLFTIPVKATSLASAIGALNLRSPTNPAAPAAAKALGEEQCVSNSTPPQIEHARPAWTQSLAESREASTSGQQAWSSVAVPATFTWQLDASSQQAQLLEQQLAQQLKAGWTDKEACRAYLIDLMRTYRESKLHLSSHVMLRLIAYLTLHQWWGALDAVLRQQPLPSLAMCPGLLLTLCQQGQFSVLPSLLTKAKEMPLQELVALLHLFLSPATDPMQQEYQQHSTKLHSQAAALVTAAEKAFADHGNSHSSAAPDTALQDKITKAAYAAAAVVGFTAQEVCFHPIVAVTHDGTLLLAALRQLSGSQALTLAQYLLKLMTKYSGTLSDTMPQGLEESKSPLRISKLQQVLEWLGSLFDAHIQTLQRQPGSAQVLSKLQKLVQQHVAATKQLAAIRGIAEHMTSHAVLPYANQQADSVYSVELLDFRIH